MTLSDKFQHLGGQFWSKSSPNEELTERISHIMKGLAGVNSLTVTYNFFKILKSPWMNCRLMQNINWLLLGFPQDILPVKTSNDYGNRQQSKSRVR